MTDPRLRYSRQIRLSEIGEAGQARLSEAEVELGGRGFVRTIEEKYLRAAGVSIAESDEATPSKSASTILGQASQGENAQEDRKIGRIEWKDPIDLPPFLPSCSILDLASLFVDRARSSSAPSFEFENAAAREVAEGAVRALVAMRRILGVGAP